MPEKPGMLDELRRKRDELKVRLHLASKEAQDEWQELEQKWDDFSSRARLSQTAEGLGAATQLLGEELRKGYERLKKAL